MAIMKYSLIVAVLVVAYLGFISAKQIIDPTHRNEISVSEDGRDIYYAPLPRDQFVKRFSTYTKEALAKNQQKKQKPVEFEDHMYEFVPQFLGTLNSDGSPLKYTNTKGCFQSVSATLKFSSDQESATIDIDLGKATSLFCSDAYLLLDRRNSYWNIFMWSGHHTMHLTKFALGEREDILSNGIQIFWLPDGIVGSIEDIAWTLTMFLGPWTVEESIYFLSDQWKQPFVPRTSGYIANKIDKSYVKSGDYLAIRKWDGLDPMIMFGTGSRTGHTAIAQWFGNELFVCESTGETFYWPPPYGIIRTPWDQWMEQANDAGFDVSLLPLSSQMRAKYNVTAANEFFMKNQGYPYGYHNFIFGWLDTQSGNLPPPLNEEILVYACILFEKLDSAVAYQIYLDGFNMRLATRNLDMYGILEELQARNMTFNELYTIPEDDNWQYEDGKAMVCSSFVTAMYKAGGLFGPNFIQATEFTPKDSYQLPFYQTNKSSRPSACQVDDLPWCQLMGKYKMDLPGVNSLTVYPHMMEKCGGLPPNYERFPPNC